MPHPTGAREPTAAAGWAAVIEVVDGEELGGGDAPGLGDGEERLEVLALVEGGGGGGDLGHRPRLDAVQQPAEHHPRLQRRRGVALGGEGGDRRAAEVGGRTAQETEGEEMERDR